MNKIKTPPLVLVVDNDRDLADLLGTILKAQGFQVLTAYSYNHGRTLIEESHSEIACLLTDTQLGDGLGTALIKLFKEKQPNRHAIRTSGNSEYNTKRSGETDFIAKPFPSNVLIDKVKGLLYE